MAIKFGPAGNSDSFYDEGNKHSRQAPAWLKAMGLNAYEYSFGRGVRMKHDTASAIRDQAEQNGIAMSVHAPYYINFANEDDGKIEKSINYLVESAKTALWLGASRVVFHPGVAGKDRRRSFDRIRETLPTALEKVYEANPNIIVCPETMGKIIQIGDLEETLDLCMLDDAMLPCVDFGHLHARTLGEIAGREQYIKVLDSIEQRLGSDRAKRFHIHFSRIEHTARGEKRHWTYADTQFGPDFEPLGELLAERGLEPTVICESKGTMAEDAAAFKAIYEGFANSADTHGV